MNGAPLPLRRSKAVSSKHRLWFDLAAALLAPGAALPPPRSHPMPVLSLHRSRQGAERHARPT